MAVGEPRAAIERVAGERAEAIEGGSMSRQSGADR